MNIVKRLEKACIVKIYANETDKGIYGDIYHTSEEVIKNHPESDVLTGYCISDYKGIVPEGAKDWCFSIEEAIGEYDSLYSN